MALSLMTQTHCPNQSKYGPIPVEKRRDASQNEPLTAKRPKAPQSVSHPPHIPHLTLYTCTLTKFDQDHLRTKQSRVDTL